MYAYDFQTCISTQEIFSEFRLTFLAIWSINFLNDLKKGKRLCYLWTKVQIPKQR